MISDRGKKNHFSSSNNMFFQEEIDLFPFLFAFHYFESSSNSLPHFAIYRSILFFDNPFLAMGNLARLSLGLSLAQLLPSLGRIFSKNTFKRKNIS